MALHIPGLDDPRSPEQILNEVHQSLYNRYKRNQRVQQYTENAAFLSEFLQSWKEYANGANQLSSNIFTANLMQQLQQRFPPNIKKLFKFKNISGEQFEKQMSEFIYAALTGTGSGIDLDVKSAVQKINVGNRAADSVIGELDTTVLNAVGYSLLEDIKNTIDPELQKQYQSALVRVGSIQSNKFGLVANTAQVSAGKIDIDAGQLSVKWTFTAFDLNSAPLEKALTLLSKAKITAKNYGTDWYTVNIIRKQKMRWRGVDTHSLRFGQTNLYKVLLMVMGALNYSEPLIASVYYSSITTDNIQALRHFQHIQAVYEITGFGQTIVNDQYKELQEADYLIWNDPSSVTIVVHSTANLIAQIFDGIFEENFADLNLSRGISLDYTKLK